MRSIVIVGSGLEFHVGHHLHSAAHKMGFVAELCDVAEAFAGPRLLQKLNWRFGDRRPTQMRVFEKKVLTFCRDSRPSHLIATGMVPLTRETLEEIRRTGTRILCFLTDDPWNPAHRSAWFMRALPIYDKIFTPRHSNIEDLKRASSGDVSYLPFAYCPEVHFSESPRTAEERHSLECDVLFVGGADKDRVPYIRTLVKADMGIKLYGGYWNRYVGFKSNYRGMADLPTLRMATGIAKVNLCLVRRANRDGHCMRTFEVPAMKGCMLVEDTPDHREIFGPEGQAVLYFRDEKEMAGKAKFLISNSEEREHLAASSHELVVKGKNTYRDRLAAMLGVSA